MNNWKFDMKSAAVGGIATSIFNTALFLIVIKIASTSIGGRTNE